MDVMFKNKQAKQNRKGGNCFATEMMTNEEILCISHQRKKSID